MPVVNRDQERAIVQRAQQRGMAPEQIKQAVTAYRTQSAPQQAAAPQQPGFLASLAQPFTKLASSALGTIEGAGDLGGALLSKVSGNDAAYQKGLAQAKADTTAEHDFGIFGKSRPVGVDQQTGQNLGVGRSVGDILGTGGEIGSYLAPVAGTEEALGAAKAATGLLPRLGAASAQGAKFGALGGALAGGGSELAKPTSTLGSVAGATATGAAGGGALGGILPAAGILGSEAVKGAKAVGEFVAPAAKSVIGTVGRAADRGLNNLKESAVAAKALETAEPAVQKAVSAGVPKEVVDGIRSLSPKVAKSGQEMLDIAEKGSKDVFSKAQPKQVVGRAILEPVETLLKHRDEVGTAIGEMRRTLPDTTMNVSDVYASLRGALEQKGVKVGSNGFTLRTAASSIPSGDAKFYEDVLHSLRPNPEGVSIRGVKYLDNVRQRFFKEYNLSKLGQQPFSDEVDNFVTEMRRQLSEKIGLVAPKYGELNQKYATTMQALKDFVKLIGYKGNLEDLTDKELRTSEVAMRTLGNAASSADDVIGSIVELAKTLGYKGSKEEIDQLIRLADIFEALLGSKQTRSLSGQIGRGMSAAESNLTSAAEGAKTGGVVGMISGVLSKHLGATTDEQVQALRELLKAQGGPKSGYLSP